MKQHLLSMRFCYRTIVTLLFFSTALNAQKPAPLTIVRGLVTDVETREPIAFASISVPGVPIGVRTDEDGLYLLKTDKKIEQLRFSYLGYKPQTIPIKPGIQQTVDVALEPESQQLGEITIKAEKYRNKNNPIVELIQKVIDHRDLNRIENLATYSDEQYEKVFFGLSNMRDKFKQRGMMKSIQFLLENVDTSKLAGTPVVPIFLQENVLDFYSQADPKKWKKYVKATKSVRFPGYVDQDGMDKSLQYLYEEVDIYDNFITLLTDQFLSPIANNAPLFYRYYPKDTIEENGKKIVRLEFFPRNKTDMLLQGDLYIALDSTYPVTRVNFTINPDINLNWVKDLTIEQDFQFLPGGKWILSSEDYRMQFSITERGLGLVAQRYVVHRNPSINQDIKDSLLEGISEIVTLPGAEKVDTTYWSDARATPLNKAETATYTNMDSLLHTRFYKVTTRILYPLIGGYVATGKYFDIGPMNTFYAFNEVEGQRLRFGGRTSTGLSKQFRVEGFAGYGLRDQRMKYSASAVYALPGTDFFKFPVSRIRVEYLHDILLPTQNSQGTQAGNLGTSVVRGANDKFFFVDRFNLQYEREFPNHFSYTAGFQSRQFRPEGALNFIVASVADTVYDPVISSTPFVQIRYAPGEKIYQGNNGRLLVDFNYIATLRYARGINGFLNGQYNYHELTASLYKYTNLPPFGYNTFYLEAGGVFGKVPYPLLTIHRGNQTYINYQFAYNLMNFMEFISDRYATVITEHYFNGFFLNKIPVLRRFKLREIVTCKVLYGKVSRQNQPEEASGLYEFPQLADGNKITYTLEKQPYVEASVGISNIFKVLRVDLVRRFTYLDHPDATPFGVRAQLLITF